jgi:hypothetical protein
MTVLVAALSRHRPTEMPVLATSMGKPPTRINLPSPELCRRSFQPTLSVRIASRHDGALIALGRDELPNL